MNRQQQQQQQQQPMTTTTSNKNKNNTSNTKEQEWWFPSYSRWKQHVRAHSYLHSWTEIFASGPRNDLIGILADKAVEAIHEHLNAPLRQNNNDSNSSNDNNDTFAKKLLDEHLPSDTESVRTKLPSLYGSALEALKQQRDNYLLSTDVDVGITKNTYAGSSSSSNIPRKGKPRESRTTTTTGNANANTNTNNLGYAQLVNLGAWFIPSETIKSALMPIVLDLPSGALRNTITTTVSNAIPLAQPPLDAALKSSVMGVIKDPRIRDTIKSRTQKILRVEMEPEIEEQAAGNKYVARSANDSTTNWIH